MITTACLLVIEYDDNGREMRSCTAYGTMPAFADAATIVDTFTADTHNTFVDYRNRLPEQKGGQ